MEFLALPYIWGIYGMYGTYGTCGNVPQNPGITSYNTSWHTGLRVRMLLWLREGVSDCVSTTYDKVNPFVSFIFSCSEKKAHLQRKF